MACTQQYSGGHYDTRPHARGHDAVAHRSPWQLMPLHMTVRPARHGQLLLIPLVDHTSTIAGLQMSPTPHLQRRQRGRQRERLHLDERVLLRLGALPARPVVVRARLPVQRRVHRQAAFDEPRRSINQPTNQSGSRVIRQPSRRPFAGSCKLIYWSISLSVD
jgi:hypothetical protein